MTRLDIMDYRCDPDAKTTLVGIAMKITASESQVMEVLWRESPLESGDIAQRLAPETQWSPKTVRTLLDRLVAKRAIERCKRGRHYSYRPLLSREQWLHDQTESLVRTHCDGRLAPLVAAFAQAEQLSETDREEIRALLEKLS